MALFKVFCFFFGLAFLSACVQSSNQNVRFYKVNNKMQSTRILFVEKKGQESGCHNFIVNTRVQRFNQYGYQFCSVYSEKNCASQSVISASREKNNTPTTQLSQGFSWYPIATNKGGAKLASWFCE